MPSTLHCPFCGAKLRIDNIGFYVCPTVHCALWECEGVPQKVIKSLISGKKAQDALKVATDFIGFVNTSRHADGALAAMAICKLNEITSITKREE